MMQDYEIDAYLGEALAATTAEQYAAIREADRLIERDLHPGHDDEEGQCGDCAAAFSGAVQYILGSASMAEQGRRLMRARLDASEAKATLDGAVTAAAAAGVSESQIARETGLARDTVRAALGK